MPLSSRHCWNTHIYIYISLSLSIAISGEDARIYSTDFACFHKRNLHNIRKIVTTYKLPQHLHDRWCDKCWTEVQHPVSIENGMMSHTHTYIYICTHTYCCGWHGKHNDNHHFLRWILIPLISWSGQMSNWLRLGNGYIFYAIIHN